MRSEIVCFGISISLETIGLKTKYYYQNSEILGSHVRT
jgi:hypothetical protein